MDLSMGWHVADPRLDTTETPRVHSLSRCVRNEKDYRNRADPLPKSMSLKVKELTCSRDLSARKEGDTKLKVSLVMLLKTHGEKMSTFRLLAILMKTNNL